MLSSTYNNLMYSYCTVHYVQLQKLIFPLMHIQIFSEFFE